MSQAAKDAKKAAKTDARRRQFAVVNAAAHAPKVTPLAMAADADGASRWPADFADMARRIEREGGTDGWGVPNRDREMVAKNAPTGSFTRRDGKSVWAHLLDSQALPAE